MMIRKESATNADNPTVDFAAAITQAGIEPLNLTIISDGKNHRFKVAGDKSGEKTGWYVFYGDDLPAGAFGDWRKGINGKWCSKKENQFTPDESAAYRRRMEEVRAKREAEERARHLKACERAKAEWSSAHPATPDHPYLIAKSVMPHGLKVDSKGQLLVPLYCADEKLWTLEYISPNADKKFMYGGRKRGCFFPFGPLAEVHDKKIIIFGEGFATSATVREANELPTVSAMDKGNLKPVAEALHKEFPAVLKVFAADNDEHGRGEKDAREAAQAVGGIVVVCPEPGDFNDLARIQGLEAVQAVFEAALKIPDPESNGAEPESVKILIKKENADAEPKTVKILIKKENADLVPGVPALNSLFDGPHVSLDPRDLPILESSLFPSWLGNMVAAVSEATETPPELAGLLGMAIVATCVQKIVIVRPSPDHREPLSVFVAPALDSGNRKTAVLNEMTKPFLDWEYEQAEKLQPEVDKGVSERKTLEGRIGRLRKDAEKLEGKEFEELMAKIVEMEKNLPEVPSIPRLWTQDVTPERLGSLMDEMVSGSPLLAMKVAFSKS